MLEFPDPEIEGKFLLRERQRDYSSQARRLINSHNYLQSPASLLCIDPGGPACFETFDNTSKGSGNVEIRIFAMVKVFIGGGG